MTNQRGWYVIDTDIEKPFIFTVYTEEGRDEYVKAIELLGHTVEVRAFGHAY